MVRFPVTIKFDVHLHPTPRDWKSSSLTRHIWFEAGWHRHGSRHSRVAFTSSL